MKNFDRRKFIKTTSLSAAFASSSNLFSNKPRSSDQKYMGDFASPKLKNIKAAFIGVGYRGKGHLKSFASLPGTEVVAISDLYQDNVDLSVKILKELNQPTDKIKTYWGSENKWKLMLKEVKPDIVFISTNWKNHGVMAVQTMKNNAHAFVEVPLALSINELWKIVNTSEKYSKHCMMMENVNYGRDELMYLNMCRKGVIGELLHDCCANVNNNYSHKAKREKSCHSDFSFAVFFGLQPYFLA